MNEVFRAAAALQAVFVEEAWRFCFIGGLAVLRWGEASGSVPIPEVTASANMDLSPDGTRIA